MACSGITENSRKQDDEVMVRGDELVVTEDQPYRSLNFIKNIYTFTY